MYNRTATQKNAHFLNCLHGTTQNLDDCSDKVEYEEEGGGEVEDLDGEDDEDKDGVAGEKKAKQDSERKKLLIPLLQQMLTYKPITNKHTNGNKKKAKNKQIRERFIKRRRKLIKISFALTRTYVQ